MRFLHFHFHKDGEMSEKFDHDARGDDITRR